MASRIQAWADAEVEKSRDDIYREHEWNDPFEWWRCHNLRGWRKKGAKRFIYFVRDADTVKIGEAENVDKRIASLKTANLRLEEIGRVPSWGIRDTEIHHWLDDWRLDPDREFFRLVPMLKDWIDECVRIRGVAIPPNWERTYAKATSMRNL